MGKKYFIIPIFVPHLGCPHDCVFCNQERITGRSIDISIDDVEQTINDYLDTFPKDRIGVEVAFYGGSFTGINPTIQKELLSIPLEYKKRNIIDGIRLSTRPDYIDESILDLLEEYQVDTIELGVQSLDDEVLKKSGRGHDSSQVFKAVKLIKDYGFNLGLQMMVGLVGDTREKSLATAKKFIELNPYCVRIYPTLVIKDTHLERLYKKEIYLPLSLEDSINITTDILMLLEFHNINVIRVGLQPTDSIRIGGDVIDGPFHPSYRQLVESNIYRIMLKDYLDGMDNNVLLNETIEITSNSKNISNIAGHKSGNIKYLIDRYQLKNIKIYGKNIPENNLGINIGNVEYTINKQEMMGKYLRAQTLI